MDAELLFDLEKKLLDPSVRLNRDELERLLSPNFLEFGCSGRVWDRNGIVQALVSGPSNPVEAFDFQSRELAPDVVLVTYKTKKTNADGSPYASLRSSIWKLVEDEWQMIFHQGTKRNTI
jgi:hypothetical protein